MITIPYCYLIGWSKLNRWYYGCRYSKKCKPEDLWVTYFTSSKYVKQFREENGEPDVIEIRKIFKTREEAGAWEYKVLCRLKVLKNDKWLNRTNNKVHDRTGTPHSEETKLKLKKARGHNAPFKGRKHTPETRILMSKKRKLWLNTEVGKLWREKQRLNCDMNKYLTREIIMKTNTNPEHIARRSLGNTGKIRSLKARKNISKARIRYLKKLKENVS